MNDQGIVNIAPACASCKHQRKRCDEHCLLAPYFPATRYHDYVSAHKLFGLNNILRIMSAVEPHKRQATADTLMVEGIIWRSDPIRGCLGYATKLQTQIENGLKELDFVNQRLAFFRERAQQEQQQKMQLETLMAGPSLSLMLQPGSQEYYCHLPSQSSPSSSIPPFEQLGTSLSTSLPLQHQSSGCYQTPIVPNTASETFYTGDQDMKSLEHGYHYQSTLEEGADVKPFDIQPIDQLIEPAYQYEHALTTYRDQGECSSKARGKQPMEYPSDEETESDEGVEHMDNKKE